MDPLPANLRPSSSVASRISAVDVSQLDKINAIPNKTTNNVLLDGLCQEDQLYLDALMDEDSADSLDEASNGGGGGGGGSPWSPAMAAERPRMNMTKAKRLKRLKPAYTITMSLEDISYIRPSWGMSKGIVKKLDGGGGNGKRSLLGRKSNRSKRGLGNQTKQQATQAAERCDGSPDTEATLATRSASILNTYNAALLAVSLLLLALMLLSYHVDQARHRERTLRAGLEFSSTAARTFSVLRFSRDSAASGPPVVARELRVHYGRGLASNLRPDECTCQMYEAETRKHRHLPPGENLEDGDQDQEEECFACLDWASRANLQVLVVDGSPRPADERPEAAGGGHYSSDDVPAQPTVAGTARVSQAPLDEDLSIACYDVRWQSYDALQTPLVDCFQLPEGDQWFGLGDTHTEPSVWPLNKLEASAALATNLTSEFGGGASGSFSEYNAPQQQQQQQQQQWLVMGAQAELELVSAGGFYLGNLRSDFLPSVRISAERRELCLSVECTERCTSSWPRLEHHLLSGAPRLRRANNLLEYSICSASSWKVLVSRLINQRQGRALSAAVQHSSSPPLPPHHGHAAISQLQAPGAKGDAGRQSSALERLESPGPPGEKTNQQQQQTTPTRRPLEPIGLVERTLFVTSQEFLPQLDGQTLRQHVDKIVKLNLKTSPILVLDTRWQLYSGSFRMNPAYFPKAKLLFEILHNKGFKIVLTVKPYVDASIGVGALNALLDQQRLVVQRRSSTTTTSAAGRPERDDLEGGAGTFSSEQQVVRRESFFSFRNQTISWFNGTAPPPPRSRRAPPFLFSCRESASGHCALLDLSQAHNRAWLVETIKRSSFLSAEADALALWGAHPEGREWDAHYRQAMGQLVDRLFHQERYFVLPAWTGNFNYLQVGPRARSWDSLRSLVDSVLSLGMLGFSLIHPGSVWGDLPAQPENSPTQSSGGSQTSGTPLRAQGPLVTALEDEEDLRERAQRDERELLVRWLQVAVFLPVLQFNDLAPLERHGLQEQLQALVRLRKLHVVPEIKRHLPHTALLQPPPPPVGNATSWRPPRPTMAGPVPYQLPALRYTWASGTLLASVGGAAAPNRAHAHSSRDPQPEAIGQQFMVGPDLLVAPVLQAGQRQKDIYLPVGMWHDELRQTNIRGGKWLRNYPIELNEIAWFTRARR